MILRPLSPQPASPAIEPVWVVVERTQQQDFRAGCWLVPQPSHAALSGEIAAHLDDRAFPGITAEIVHAIALHDAGWSPDDAAVIHESRAKGDRARPYSFISSHPKDTAAAWTSSIEIAGKGSPIGGFLVSRHFAAIGETYRGRADAKTVKVMEAFLAQEHARQQRVRKKLPQPDSELDRLVAALQFCDLLSLYISCGAAGDVEFPQTVEGTPIRLRRNGETATLSPNPLASAQTFDISGLRHPRAEEGQGHFSLHCRP